MNICLVCFRSTISYTRIIVAIFVNDIPSRCGRLHSLHSSLGGKWCCCGPIEFAKFKNWHLTWRHVCETIIVPWQWSVVWDNIGSKVQRRCGSFWMLGVSSYNVLGFYEMQMDLSTNESITTSLQSNGPRRVKIESTLEYVMLCYDFDDVKHPNDWPNHEFDFAFKSPSSFASATYAQAFPTNAPSPYKPLYMSTAKNHTRFKEPLLCPHLDHNKCPCI